MRDISVGDIDIKPDNQARVAEAAIAQASVAPKRFRRLGQFVVLLLAGLVAGTILIEAISTREITVTGASTTVGHSKWSPSFWVGNLDEPLPWPEYRPADPHRMLRWSLRNPLHNFTFYIIGIADRDFSRTGRFPETVFNPNDGWNWAVCKYGWARLPFVSFKMGGFCSYLGWRERGNFGISLRYHREEKILTTDKHG